MLVCDSGEHMYALPLGKSKSRIAGSQHKHILALVDIAI